MSLAKMPTVISSPGSVFLWVSQTWQVPGARKQKCLDVLPKDMVLTAQFDTNWPSLPGTTQAVWGHVMFFLCVLIEAWATMKQIKSKSAHLKPNHQVSDCIFYIAVDGQCWSPSLALCVGSAWCSHQNTADRGCSRSMCFLKEGQGSGEKLCHQFN